jgi:hypothetical protein
MARCTAHESGYRAAEDRQRRSVEVFGCFRMSREVYLTRRCKVAFVHCEQFTSAAYCFISSFFSFSEYMSTIL